MNLFRLIKEAVLRLAAYRRLVASVACFIYASCSTQVKDGLLEGQQSNIPGMEERKFDHNNESFIKKFNPNLKLLKIDEQIDPNLYLVWWKNRFQKLSELYTKYLDLDQKNQKVYNWNGYTLLQIEKKGSQKFFAFLLKENRVAPNTTPTLLEIVTDDIVFAAVHANKKRQSGLKEIFKTNVSPTWKSYIKILKILLYDIHHTQTGIHSGLFIGGANLFHKLIENIDLEKFQVLYNSKNEYIKYQRNLSNSNGLTPFGFAIEKYGQANLKDETQDKLEKIINILLNDNTITTKSDKTETGDNELHLVVRLHSNKDLPENKKIFLAEVAKKLRTSNLGLNNKGNKNQETPLHVAIKLENQRMSEILFPWTDLTTKDMDGNTPVYLAVDNITIFKVFVKGIQLETIHKDNIKAFFIINNNQNSQSPLYFLCEKISNLFSNNPEQPEITEYMKGIYALERKRSDSSITQNINNKRIERLQPTETVTFNQEECSICLGHCYPTQIQNRDTTNLLKIVSCKHVFHEWCLVRWYYSSNSMRDTCPYCRDKIDK